MTCQFAPSTADRFGDVWALENKLEEGSFGSIYEIKHKSTQRVEAVKMIVSQRRAARLEAQIWRCIGEHRNIVKLHEVYEEGDTMFMVMDKCECHMLNRLSTGFHMREVAPMFEQMLLGIAHMHSLNIAHRDVKFQNFLCLGEGFRCIKLCDFGFSITVPPKGVLNEICGTPPFISPEMLMRSYGLKTDIWSIGVCCYYLLSGARYPYEPPDHSPVAMKKAISEGSQVTADFEARKHVPFAAKLFTANLLNRKATSRLTAEGALQQPFLNSGGEMSPTPSEISTIASNQDLQRLEEQKPNYVDCHGAIGDADALITKKPSTKRKWLRRIFGIASRR